MATSIETTNQGIVNAVTSVHWLNVLGWIFLGIVIIGGAFWFYMWNRNKKLFNKKITVFDIVGQYFTPIARDTAKTVKIGKGGFEILYLKKFKTWKIAYGGRVGKDTYYFFIMPDGYWYNGMLSANINKINADGGLIPIVSANPLMRGQYTSLEKQIDALFTEKKSFMDKWGVWIFAIAFILIAGIIMYLMAKDIPGVISQQTALTDKMGQLVDKVNTLLTNAKITSTGGSGLVPAA